MFEQNIAIQVNRLARKINRQLEQVYKPTGLSASQAYILLWIASNPGQSPSRLVETFELEKSTVTRLVHSLEKSHLVRRQASLDGDQRQQYLFATDSGIELTAQLESINREAVDLIISKMDSGQLLDAVKAALSAMSSDSNDKL